MVEAPKLNGCLCSCSFYSNSLDTAVLPSPNGIFDRERMQRWFLNRVGCVYNLQVTRLQAHI